MSEHDDKREGYGIFDFAYDERAAMQMADMCSAIIGLSLYFGRLGSGRSRTTDALIEGLLADLNAHHTRAADLEAELKARREQKPVANEHTDPALLHAFYDPAFEQAATVAASAEVPERFYIACSRHSGRGKALWWGPNFAGYTPYLEQAGTYTEGELRARDYHFFDALSEDVPVPVPFARGLAVSLIDTGHAKARPFWGAEDLRAALAVAKQEKKSP